MRCAVHPYEGNDPYIYFSFCKKDEYIAGPIIESMANSGYRVWYDGGNIPDDIWAETVIERLSNSRVCMALISKASVNVHACRSDINTALDQGVLIVPILTEAFSLTPAMRLLMERTYHVKAYSLALTSRNGMETLLNEAVKPAECGLCKQAAYRDKPWAVVCIDENPPAEDLPPRPLPPIDDPNPIIGPHEPEESPAEDNPEKPVIPVSDGQETVIQKKTERIPKPNKKDDAVTIKLEKTVAIRPKESRVLIDLSTGRVFRLGEGVSRLGRSKANDFCFNERYISAKHAQLFTNEDGKVLVRDVGSTNGTFLNGVKIDTDKPCQVGNFSIITLAKDQHLLYLTGKSVSDMLRLGYSAYITCEENGEVMGLHPGFILGRSNPWPSGAFSEDYISHTHGVFQADERGYRFVGGHSTNGTTINGIEIHEGQETDLLKTGDEIGVAGMYWVKYNVVLLRED